MRKSAHHILFLICLLFLSFAPAFARAESVAIGVNVIDPYKLDSAKQDDLLNAIKLSGVNVIRASITLNDAGVAFAQRAWQHGIQIEWMIYHFGGYDPFGQRPLSAADPEQFRNSFSPVLSQLEVRGITLAGFELGNEINLSGTNPEFPPRQSQGKQLGLNDLNNSLEGRQIAKGYLQYLKVLAVLKDIRDHSKLNQHTPIMTAGFGSYEQDDGPLPKWAKGDVVSVNATLDYMRAHGLDSLVDAYAVHIYPHDDNPGDPKASAARQERLARYDLAECRSAASANGKACWITEWGFKNKDAACPIDDVNRAALVRETMGHFRAYVEQGRLTGLLFFSWNSSPGSSDILGSIWRCGALTESGKLAIDSNLLK